MRDSDVQQFRPSLLRVVSLGWVAFICLELVIWLVAGSSSRGLDPFGLVGLMVVWAVYAWVGVRVDGLAVGGGTLFSRFRSISLSELDRDRSWRDGPMASLTGVRVLRSRSGASMRIFTWGFSPATLHALEQRLGLDEPGSPVRA